MSLLAWSSSTFGAATPEKKEKAEADNHEGGIENLRSADRELLASMNEKKEKSKETTKSWWPTNQLSSPLTFFSKDREKKD